MSKSFGEEERKNENKQRPSSRLSKRKFLSSMKWLVKKKIFFTQLSWPLKKNLTTSTNFNEPQIYREL